MIIRTYSRCMMQRHYIFSLAFIRLFIWASLKRTPKMAGPLRNGGTGPAIFHLAGPVPPFGETGPAILARLLLGWDKSKD